MANAINSAVDGDTVVVPAGNCTWTSTLVVSNKSISIIGSGSDTVLTNSTGSALIRWTLKPTGNTPPGFSRLSGFTLNDSGCGGDANIVILGDSPNMRLDHVFFNVDNCTGLYVDGYVRGVIDHNTFDMTTQPGWALVLVHNSWENVNEMPNGAGAGGQSWIKPSTMGTANQIIVENNIISAPSSALRFFTDDKGGLRATYRFNTLTNGIFADHGTDTGGRQRALRHVEFYNNSLQYNVGGSPVPSMISRRGGGGTFFDNTATGNVNAAVVDLKYFRHQDTREFVGYGRCQVQPVISLTRSGNTATARVENHGIHRDGSYLTIAGASQSAYNGTFLGHYATDDTFTFTVSGSPATPAVGNITTFSPFDGNNNSTGYRCLDQTGAGQGDRLITGDGPSYGVIDNPGKSNQALEPAYGWNNRLNGSLSHLLSQEPDVIAQNRDFYNENASFNGTTGVGRGPRSQRPATCTVGTAWWATDQGNWRTDNGGTPDGTLDKCTATNTWTNAWYTPFTYPHPLISGVGGTPPTTPAPASPENVRVIR